MNNSIQFEGPNKTNSRNGVASFIVSLLEGLLMLLSFLPTYLSIDYEDYIGWQIMVAILFYTSIPLGSGLGLASIVKKEPKKVYATFGLLINLTIILFLLASFLTALLESGGIQNW